MGRMIARLRAVFIAILGLMTRKRMQRISALFFVFVLFVGTIAPIGPWVATAAAEARNNKPVGEKVKPLASAKPQAAQLPISSGVGAEDAPKMEDNGKPVHEDAGDDKPREKAYEDVSARTATSKTWVNKDGSRTLEYSLVPKHYQENGEWKDMNDSVTEDKTYRSQAKLENESILNNPLSKDTQAINTHAGPFNAKLKPFEEGVTINFRGKEVTIRPVGGNNVRPVVETTKEGHEIISYKEAWPGVDLEYELSGSSLKETIVIKRPGTQNNFVYSIDGAKFKAHPKHKGAMAIEGIDPEEFFIAPLTVSVGQRGVISEEVAQQVTRGKTLAISLSADWLKSQPQDAFPIAVDPTYVNNVGGTYGNFVMFKSDGYSCGNSNCDPQAGTLYDNGWKSWRTAFYIPYPDMRGKIIHGAYVKFIKKYRSYWTGVDEYHNFYTAYAPCHGYNCVAGTWSNFGVGTADWGNVTPTFNWMKDNVPTGGWFQLWGEEGPWTSYKGFEPTQLEMNIYYDTPTPVAQPATPTDKQVLVTTQPSIGVNAVSDADGESVEYYHRIATAPDGEGGAVVNSGWSSSTQFTVPEGVLQDGTTYYWHTYTRGTSSTGTVTAPNWVRSFKVDLRTGKDSTQAYDTAGPFDIALATGNVTTSTSTHSIGALGGNIGVGLNYNTPARSAQGLSAQYWNVPAGYTGWLPTDPPHMSRVDQNINFDWSSGSPGSGIGQDYFFANWKGYFVAPEAGTYYFGINRDDRARVSVKGQVVAEAQCCGGDPVYGSPTVLAAGEVVPIDAQFYEHGGLAYTQLFVKGAVPEQIVPKEWLRTEAKAVTKQKGLEGRYYTSSGLYPTFPSDESDPSRLLMTRVDPKITMNWGEGPLYVGGPLDYFMVRWRGYVSVPVTGTYNFGSTSDDGTRIYVGTTPGQPDETALNIWQPQGATTSWGGNISLEAGKYYPITVEYYEVNGPASMNLLVRGANGTNVPSQEVPSDWLTPGAPVLPDGWSLGLDPDGNVNYERLRVTSGSVILTDSTGMTHEYTVQAGGGYKPPVNEDGQLTKNDDNSYRLVDVDGRIYVFDQRGLLTSLTTPQDDLKPAALQYEYAGNPARLVKISDGVNAARNGTLHYGGDSECSTQSGFDTAPQNMLCAFKTTDGKKTNFYYKNGQMSRVERPGGDITDYGYDKADGTTNPNCPRCLSMVRDGLAVEAIAAGVRANDASTTIELSYDAIGRASSVTMPAPTAGANRAQRTYEYTPVAWSEPQIVKGDVPDGNPVLVNWGPNKLAMLARMGTSAMLRTYEKSSWGDWQSLGSCIQDDPGVASMYANRLDVFIRGCDNQLWTKYYVNGVWSDYVGLGGTSITSSPSVASWGPDRLDVFARGPSNQLLHRWYPEGPGWSGFEDFGGCIPYAPGASSWGFDRLDVFVAGCDNPSTFYQKYWASGWSNYIALLSEKITSAPQSVSTPDKKIHIVARGSDGSLKYLHFTGRSWSGWSTLQPCITGSPAITQDGDLTVIAYKGCDGKLYQMRKGPNDTGITKMHIVGASEPVGYSDQVTYDNMFRTTKNYDKSGMFTTTEWDPVKDMVRSTTDPTGLKSTTIYDSNDRPIDGYGPAPSSWFGSDRKPLAAYVNQVPHTQSRYDEGITGLGVAIYDNKKLLGAPKQHATAFNNVPYASYGVQPNTNGIVPTDGLSFSASGKVLLSQVGRYNFRVWHSDGARIYVDNKRIVDDWVDGGERFSPSGYHDNAVANTWVNIRVDAYKSGTAERVFAHLKMTPPGSGELDDIAANLTPAYNLTTSAKVFDSQLGDVETKTNYGSKPELGQAQSTVGDVGGLNLATSMTYEPYQQNNPDGSNSYLRQTAKYMPGANTADVSTATQYIHYRHDADIDNPCTPGEDKALQAGFAKGKIEPDPDGSGPQTSRTTETVYDKAGRAVATKYNSDPWTCTTYDSRGRVAQVVVPTINGRVGRTVTNSYVVNGNPLVTSQTDSITGTITTTYDLLGRVVAMTDTFGYQATTTYDNLGRVSQRTSLAGSEVPTYDSLDRVTGYALDGVTYATITYDQYSRVAGVEYPQAQAGGNKLKLSQIQRDNLQRVTGSTYTFSNATTFTESVTLNQQRGIVTGYTDTFNGQTAGATYQYDKAGRMTQATVDTMRYQYAFGAQDATCTSLSGYNANAHKNSNRTTYTVTNLQTSAATTTNNCYNNADQLVNSADVQVGTPTYDDHGNTTQLAGNGTPISFTYDAVDANTAITQGDNKVEYIKSASGAVLTKKEYRNNTLDKIYRYAAGVLVTCDVANQSNCSVVDKYVSLPGGVSLTLKTTGNIYSVKNFHGDTALTVNDAGVPTSSVYMYDPFGQSLASTTFSTAGAPSNASNEGMGWAASPTRKVESLFSVPIIQMGARVYLPTMGRFLQVDPIEGGMANAYVYALDPINGNDYSGMALSVTTYSGMQGWSGAAALLQPARTVAQIQPARTVSQIQPTRSASTIQATSRKPLQSSGRASAPAFVPRPPVVLPPPPLVLNVGATKIPVQSTLAADWTRYTPPNGNGLTRTLGTGGANLIGFNLGGAMSSASDYAKVGGVIGGTAGCVGGAVGISLAGAIALAPGGCIVGSEAGSSFGSFVFGAVGFVQGAFETKYADTFSM